MLYIYQGELHITESGRAVPEYKKLESDKKYKGKKLAEALTFCYYVHTKIDLVAKRPNMYWQYPIQERKERVMDHYGLFRGDSSKLEGCSLYSEFAEFYISLMQTDNDRNYEAFRAKAEFWRRQLASMDNSPKEELDIAKALQTASELSEEYKGKSDLEVMGEHQKMMGLYLFEVPEDKKPFDMRLKL